MLYDQEREKLIKASHDTQIEEENASNERGSLQQRLQKEKEERLKELNSKFDPNEEVDPNMDIDDMPDCRLKYRVI